MKKFLKRLLGIDKLEEAKNKAFLEQKKAEGEAVEAVRLAEAAKKEAERINAEIKEQERLAKLTPKERATELKQPFVAVLEVNVNDQNPRNGFFELDWNDYFIIQLKAEGYYGDTDEAIIDKWFSELCRNVGAEEGINMDRRGSGYINVNQIGNGKSEIS